MQQDLTTADELEELAAEIARVEGLPLDDARARALALMPWLTPLLVSWDTSVLASAAAVARPLGPTVAAA